MPQESKKLPIKKNTSESIAKLESELSVANIQGDHKLAKALIKIISCLKAIEKKSKGK
jgi:hypothetical protein